MPTEAVRRLWEDLHDVFQNEAAWPLIEAFEESVKNEALRKLEASRCVMCAPREPVYDASDPDEDFNGWGV